MQRKPHSNQNNAQQKGKLVMTRVGAPPSASQSQYVMPKDTVIDFVYYNKNCLQIFLNHTTTPDASAAVWNLLESRKIIANVSQFMQLKPSNSTPQPCFHLNVILPKECEKTFAQAIEILQQANLFSRSHFIANNVIANTLVADFEDYCMRHPGPQDDDIGEIISTREGPKIKSWSVETAQDVQRISLMKMRESVNALVSKCVETDMVGSFPTARANIDIIPSNAAKLKNCEMIASELNTVTAINPNWKVAYKEGRAYCYLLCESSEQRNTIFDHFAAHNQANQELKPLKIVGNPNLTLGNVYASFSITKKTDAKDNTKHYLVIEDNFVNGNVVLKILTKQIPALKSIPKKTTQPKIDEVTNSLTNLNIAPPQRDNTNQEDKPKPRIWETESDDEDHSSKKAFGI